jgi:hypothetical protein
MVRSGRGPFRPARARRVRTMHEIFFENLRNPARDRRAGAMRQFSTGQVFESSIQYNDSMSMINVDLFLTSVFILARNDGGNMFLPNKYNLLINK